MNVTRVKDLWLGLKSDFQLRHKLTTRAIDKHAFAISPLVQQEVALAIAQYRTAVSGTARENFHTTSSNSAFDYRARILNYSRTALPSAFVHDTQYTWEQTAALEVCSAWITQANWQSGVLRGILSKRAAGKYDSHAQELLQILEDLLAKLRSLLDEYKVPRTLGRVERKFFSEEEIHSVTVTLMSGEDLILAVQTLYQESV